MPHSKVTISFVVSLDVVVDSAYRCLDISGKDIDANLHAIRREYIGLHQVLLELESLMRVYNRPLPFPYLDLQATVEKCGKFLAPEKESGSKSFTYTLKRFNKRSEIDQLRTQLAGHSQALNICISFLQLLVTKLVGFMFTESLQSSPSRGHQANTATIGLGILSHQSDNTD